MINLKANAEFSVENRKNMEILLDKDFKLDELRNGIIIHTCLSNFKIEMWKDFYVFLKPNFQMVLSFCLLTLGSFCNGLPQSRKLKKTKISNFPESNIYFPKLEDTIRVKVLIIEKH